MNTEPPTGDDLNRMLVSMKQNVLEGAVARPVRRGRRNWGIALGIIAFLGLGAASGGVALGLVPSPFTASAPVAPVTSAPPAPSPSTPATEPTPDPAPTATRPAVPNSTVPLTCAQIGDRADVTRIDPNIKPFEITYAVPSIAALADAGVLSCQFNADGTDGTDAVIHFSILADADAGKQRVTRLQEGGHPSLGIGDASADACDTTAGSCVVSVVAGAFWIEAQYSKGTENVTSAPTDLKAVLSSLAAALAPLAPVAPWPASGSVWNSVTSCGAMTMATPMGEILGSSAVGSPSEISGDATDGIRSAHHSLLCLWDTRETASAPLKQMTVDLAVDGAWKLDEMQGTDQAGTPIKVEGADAAYYSCGKGEGAICWLDVDADGSWLQVGMSAEQFSRDIPTMVRVAASLIAGQKGR